MTAARHPYRATDRLFRVSLADTIAWVISPVAAGPLWQAPEGADPEAWLAARVLDRVLDEEGALRVRATTFAELWAWQPRQACTVIAGDAERTVLRWEEKQEHLGLLRQEGLFWTTCQATDWESWLTHLPQPLPDPVTTPDVMVSDAWMHCFVGSRETLVRWAYDPRADRLVGQANNGGHWETLHPDELADLRAELDDNAVLVSPFAEEEVQITREWPAWAGPRVSSTPASNRRRPRA